MTRIKVKLVLGSQGVKMDRATALLLLLFYLKRSLVFCLSWHVSSSGLVMYSNLSDFTLKFKCIWVFHYFGLPYVCLPMVFHNLCSSCKNKNQHAKWFKGKGWLAVSTQPKTNISNSQK